jgi:broad specificity phosphatase PhoE
MAKTLYLIRHGLIQSNLDDIYAGRSHEALTPAGATHADQVGRELCGWGIRVLYASPLLRAIQTAELLSKHLLAPIVIDSDLIEMELGPWTGLSKSEIAMRYGPAYETWCTNPADFRMDGIEGLWQILARIQVAIERFLFAAPEQRAAMVTHAAVIKCAFLYINDLPLNAYHKAYVPNLSVFRITFHESRSTIVRVK